MSKSSGSHPPRARAWDRPRSSSRPQRPLRTGLILVACALTAVAGGCGRSAVSSRAVDQQLRTRVAGLDGKPPRVHGESLLRSSAVVAFYRARGFSPAWSSPGVPEKVVASIRGIERDGLTATDYHLDTLQALMRRRESAPAAGLEADLDLLLTDAIAGLIDHVRYGRVRPVSLDPGWNVNPREGAPPLETELERIAAAPSPPEAIEAARPPHFIYRGLVGALARLREIQAQGGWPVIRRRQDHRARRDRPPHPGDPLTPGEERGAHGTRRARLDAI